MSEHIRLNILTPERRLADLLEVESVVLTGSEGQIEILPGHAAMVGSLHTGKFAYTKTRGGEKVSGVISTGFFEVSQDEVTLMAETLELKAEIDLDRAKAAQKKAEEALLSPELDEHHFRKYQLKLQRALIRQGHVSQSDD